MIGVFAVCKKKAESESSFAFRFSEFTEARY